MGIDAQTKMKTLPTICTLSEQTSILYRKSVLISVMRLVNSRHSWCRYSIYSIGEDECADILFCFRQFVFTRVMLPMLLLFLCVAAAAADAAAAAAIESNVSLSPSVVCAATAWESTAEYSRVHGSSTVESGWWCHVHATHRLLCEI